MSASFTLANLVGLGISFSLLGVVRWSESKPNNGDTFITIGFLFITYATLTYFLG